MTAKSDQDLFRIVIRIALALCFRIRIGICNEVESWLRIRILTNADPKHWNPDSAKCFDPDAEDSVRLNNT